jgi:hypothetical protein
MSGGMPEMPAPSWLRLRLNARPPLKAHEFIREQARRAREVRQLHEEMDREEAEAREREHVEARFDRVRRRLASKHLGGRQP